MSAGFIMRTLKSNQRGAAIMLAMFTTMFVLFLATEISEQSIMEYLTSATEVKKVQAQYAAEACMRLSLLRIKAYQQATLALGDQVPPQQLQNAGYDLAVPLFLGHRLYQQKLVILIAPP
jgi:type II secretory pathway component PulK